jgi:hypothetical protein
MTNVKLKYNINHHINQLPGITLEKIHKVLEKHHGITPELFAADRSIPAGSDIEIPVFRLMIYSRVLAIPFENLLTVNSPA